MSTPTFAMLTRSQWGAAPPRHALEPFTAKPARTLYVHHTVTPPFGDDVGRAMRFVQAVAFDRGFTDVSYPVCIHPTGVIAEGRGVQWVGAHTEGHNSDALAISFIGCYHPGAGVPELHLTDAQVLAFRYTVAFLKLTGWLAAGAAILPHSSSKSTACPGNNVRARWADLTTPWAGEAPLDTGDTMADYAAQLDKIEHKVDELARLEALRAQRDADRGAGDLKRARAILAALEVDTPGELTAEVRAALEPVVAAGKLEAAVAAVVAKLTAPEPE